MLDYFNKNLSKRKGRRISKKLAIYDPTLEELSKASKDLNLAISDENIITKPDIREGPMSGQDI
jgi:signal recognition particle subunit SRP19